MDVTFVLTHDCNLGCGYCYAGRKFKRSMPFDVAERALDLAFDGVAPGGRVDLSYFGGEPTLEMELLERIAELATARARSSGVTLRQSITTNGTLLDEARVAKLGELELYVALSIDGNRAAHEVNRPAMGGGSSFDGASRALDLLLAAGRPFETISVITPASVDHLGASVAELLDRGVPRVSLNPCYEAVWTDERVAVWERAIEAIAATMIAWMRAGRVVSVPVFDNKILARAKGGLASTDKCPIGEGSVAVAPSGNLYPCERLVAEDAIAEHVIGHVTTGIDRAKLRALHAPSDDRHATNEECTSCVERARCSAFCACANLAETGKTNVAGGVQCWHEQTTARVADALAEVLLAEDNDAFARWFFPGVPRPIVLAKLSPARSIARERRLPLVR